MKKYRLKKELMYKGTTIPKGMIFECENAYKYLGKNVADKNFNLYYCKGIMFFDSDNPPPFRSDFVENNSDYFELINSGAGSLGTAFCSNHKDCPTCKEAGRLTNEESKQSKPIQKKNDTDQDVQIFSRRPKGRRVGQTVWVFLQWVLATGRLSGTMHGIPGKFVPQDPDLTSGAMVDPFNIPDDKLKKLYDEFMKGYE